MKQNHQSLKFESELVSTILSRNKSTTWRLFNDKSLKLGEVINLIARPELKVFAQAKIVSIADKTMGTLNKNTPVTIIKFKLI